tara:strand:- start:448 stop:564 length:117 start_codon:yes stop_codon:yes gene_type:complete
VFALLSGLASDAVPSLTFSRLWIMKAAAMTTIKTKTTI